MSNTATTLNKILRGTNGRLWVNNKLWANVKKVDVKIKNNYETVNINGELAEQQHYIGYAISGTIDVYKIDSRVTQLVAEGIKSQIMPDISIVVKAADPQVTGAERIQFINVTIDEIAPGNFENKKITEESIPFKAGGFELLDVISEL